MHLSSRVFFSLLVYLAVVPPTFANDRRFSYTYETSVLAPGIRELETWNTFRTGRHYFFRQIDQRVEYEFGVANNLMSSVYLNYSSAAADTNRFGAGGDLHSTFSLGFSNEWKYKLMDRVADPVGLGLYAEFTLDPHASELEGKILFDKEIGNLLLAFNGVVANEWITELENGRIATSSEQEVELNAGFSYAFNERISAGMEIRNINELKGGEVEHSPFFAGPIISYATMNWWATITILPQLTSFAGPAKSHLDLDEHEKLEARLLLSFHL